MFVVACGEITSSSPDAGLQSTSCDDILAADPTAADGVYWIDPDGAGPVPSTQVYCDLDGAKGWTLLLSAAATSTYFGNNSPNWGSESITGTLPTAIGPTNPDYKAPVYSLLATREIRLCFQGTTRCHIFSHGLGIPLRSFFANGITYTEYAFDVLNYPDNGVASDRAAYLSDVGFGEWAPPNHCFWLGINHQQMFSAIGLMGDANDGCTSTNGGDPGAALDDMAIGLGLQSCRDANGCAPGGTGHTAGRSCGANGVDNSGDLGPWFVFGR